MNDLPALLKNFMDSIEYRHNISQAHAVKVMHAFLSKNWVVLYKIPVPKNGKPVIAENPAWRFLNLETGDLHKDYPGGTVTGNIYSDISIDEKV